MARSAKITSSVPDSSRLRSFALASCSDGETGSEEVISSYFLLSVGS